MNDAPVRDPIIEAVRTRRRELCEKAGYDVHALCELLRSLPVPEGTNVVTLEPKRVLDKTGS